MIDGSPASREISLFSGSEVPDPATATQLCRRFYQYALCVCRCPDVCRLFRTSPAACWWCFRPTFVQKLCYKLPSVVTFTFLQTSIQNFVFFTERRQSCRVCLIQCPKFALFSVCDLKDEKLIKKQTDMKTETCKLYSRDFWIFLPNTIKIDRYNFELYRFKFGPFLDTV